MPPPFNLPPSSGSFERPAEVAVGEIPGGDNNAAFKEQSDSMYTDYVIRNRYEKDRHTYMMPIASPGGFQRSSVAFVKLAASTLLWICDWTACRFNKQPDIPDPENRDSNWILLDEHYETAMITIAPDGQTPLYRISGTYVYGHKNPNKKTIRDVDFPRPPWLEDVFNRSMPDTRLTQNLADVQQNNDIIHATIPGG